MPIPTPTLLAFLSRVTHLRTSRYSESRKSCIPMPFLDYLFHLPAIVKIALVFSGLLLSLRLRVTLELALLAGGILLDLWSGRSLLQTVQDLGGGLADTELWMLLLMTLLILEVARFMTARENADELLNLTVRLGGSHGRMVSIMALPAVIGLVPMPAGARFSAPFVEQMAAQRDPAWKTAVNYWFRHLWEYWWPLYPGVMLAATLFLAYGSGYAGILLSPVHLCLLLSREYFQAPFRGVYRLLALPTLLLLLFSLAGYAVFTWLGM